MDDCIFCKIIKGEIASYTIYEDDNFKAFLDAKPNSNGHTLIIPKKHIKDINDMDGYTFKNLLEVTQKIYKFLEEKLEFDGMHLGQNNGICQEVKHFHLHMIPKYKDNDKIIPVENIYNKIVEK